MPAITVRQMPLGQTLQTFRQLADIDQTEMGRLIGVARPTISSWERGLREPSFSQVVAWARITGQSLDVLASAVASQTEGWEFESLRAHTELRQCDSLCRESVGGFVVPPFWTPERSLILAAMWRQVEPDAEIAIPEGSAR